MFPIVVAKAIPKSKVGYKRVLKLTKEKQSKASSFALQIAKQRDSGRMSRSQARCSETSRFARKASKQKKKAKECLKKKKKVLLMAPALLIKIFIHFVCVTHDLVK